MKRSIITVGLAAAIQAAIAFVPQLSAAKAVVLDDTPRIAVISAFPPEWVALQEMLEGRSEHLDNGVTFLTGEIAGRHVVLFLSGVSMVNAAMTTQMALDRFNVEAIVFSGIAGGVDPSLNLGDLVIADQWGPYLKMVIARETPDGYKVPAFYGEPPFANYGMMFPQKVAVRREGGAGEEFEQKFWFAVDTELMQIAKAAAETLQLEDCSAANSCLSEPPKVVVGGNGVSGPAFVDNADFRRYVFDSFEAKVLDMESAAVAQVAYANGVPFIAFRSLSDLAGGSDGENEMETFMSLASQNSAAMVKAFLEESVADE